MSVRNVEPGGSDKDHRELVQFPRYPVVFTLNLRLRHDEMGWVMNNVRIGTRPK